ncbi:MBL fold metallo-hydrolase [Bogoriella caseilytica]|uniref:Glyoxylase-like metal-dependent hydrolase (Beta-lactamase superfamily II) n=1 Tax=Bogoriella caseilytica TaxID=56055 RepID=A0A3N2BGT4_9MICO|nr:MBL fold metallo-hydrolase [Bogoriella caseilytica]ROR74469.1 glyoxylase-like metal-dependent hydrolase (beta-lactamase superfamily II) [Bogoriella caseilytica]
MSQTDPDLLASPHTEPGAAPVLHQLGSVTLRKISVSEQDNNAYLLTTASGQLLIDAADSAGRLLKLIDEAGGPLLAVVTTHQHWDHHRALEEVTDNTGAAVLAGADDAAALPVEVDRELRHGESIKLGDLELGVIHLRGHTPGSVAVVLSEPADGPRPGRAHLFTGDSLFPGGVGKTDSSENFTALIDDVDARIFDAFDDTTRIYPGHGDDTLLGIERPQLAAWRERGW